jgi:hypothetical protein
MKFSHSLKKSPNFPLAHILLAIAMLAAFSGCNTLEDSKRKAGSRLPIDVVNPGGGRLAATRAYETGTRLYVMGSFQRTVGQHLPVSAHVDIQLLDARGKILATQGEDIDAKHPRFGQASGNRFSYTVSFPLETARQAARIRVLFHERLHPKP